MALKIAKLGMPKEENIVTRNKFIVNHIFPVAIKPSGMENKFLFLFAAYQDYDNSYAYFQIIIGADNAFDLDYINNYGINIKAISSNAEKEKNYKESISNLRTDNLYGTDFCFKQSEDHPLYFQCSAVRGIDQTHAAVLDVYFTRDNFILIKLYLDRITSMMKFGYNESIFLDKKYRNIEFISIEQIIYDATCKDKDTYISHYTMHCGPSKYQMNYITIADKNHTNSILKNPLDSGLYLTFYKDHTFINDIIVDENYVYILYFEYSSVDNSYKSTKALRLSHELVDKTNFINYNKIFIEKEDKL